MSHLLFQGSPGEWQRYFYIAIGVLLFGLITFLLFASGDVQDWAKAPYNRDFKMLNKEDHKNNDTDGIADTECINDIQC
jgi:hypothetical protein